jgi:transglutaminase-like putative cysteine protease
MTQSAPWLLLLPLLTTGCASFYFRNVETPAQPSPRYTLHTLPYQEYWTGVVFNGDKIGLTHLALIPPEDDSQRYEIRSEAFLAFHFLGFSKNVTLKSQDWVRDDLRLERFVHDYDLDGNKLKLSGKVEQGQLLVEREAGGRTSHEAIPLADTVYPTSAVVLYPTLHGLEIGREYSYLVYDGQRQEVAKVSQTVEAYQESDLFTGRAYRVVTSLAGQEATTWINGRGEPVLEMAWRGILISSLESEYQAKAYLAQASVNKRDVLVEYSRVRTNVLLARPRDVTAMRVAVEGLPAAFPMSSDHLQRCGQEEGRLLCLIQTADPSSMNQKADPQDDDLKPYLKPSQAIDSHDSEVRRTAQDIAGSERDPLTRIRHLVVWLQQNVRQEPVDVFSSRDVLDRRKAECQGLTWLYAAFARSLGIPTKVTNGLVYSQELDGFLYHTWAESYVGSGWLPVDPTFGQVGVDATHLKLVDGDRLSDLFPLVDIVGQIRVTILSVTPS